jgi:hypothetical protein
MPFSGMWRRVDHVKGRFGGNVGSQKNYTASRPRKRHSKYLFIYGLFNDLFNDVSEET